MLLSAVALVSTLNHVLANPRLRHASVALEVYDLDAHRALFTRNAETMMIPASTTKLLTEGTSLALLGPKFRFTTPVYRTGPLDGGVVRGDLVLVASGDPNLSQRIRPDETMAFEDEDHSYDGSPQTKAVPGDPLAVLRELAAQIVKAGVKSITGRVVIDTSLFPNEGPESGTGVQMSSIVVNDNIVDVTITPGGRPGDPATMSVSPQTPYVTFVNKVVTGAAKTDATVDVQSDDVTDALGRHTVTVTGSQPAGSSILYAYRVPDPREFARMAFEQTLRDAGVILPPPAAASPAPQTPPVTFASFETPDRELAKHVSPPLSEDVYVTLKVSQNLHAGLQPFLWAAYLAHARTDFVRAGFAQELALLRSAGLDLSGAAQGDGPGLAASFSPDFMVHYLAWAREQSWFPQLYRGLPILGVDGTLALIQTSSPARGHVFAKTGTDGFTDNLNDEGNVVDKGLAGFITGVHGHHVAFAFYINEMKGPHGEDTPHEAGQILGALAAATYLTL